MVQIRSILTISLLVFCAAFAGCRSSTQIGSQVQNTGNSSVVLAMTDTPPSNVSILSAEVTLTGATLTPGNVSLFSESTTVELTKLQTDIAYLATAANIPAGTYTAVTLTFANPLLTIENDSTSAIVSGATTCNVGSICTIAPTTIANLSAAIPLTSFTLAANSNAGLLIDVNLDNLLSATMGADFKAGTTVSAFTPAGTEAPLVGAEDVVGQVGTVSAANSTFTLQNNTGSFSLKVDSSTTFFQFPSSACTTAGFSCLRGNQILSVDIGIQPDGSTLARNILFEDSDSTDAEVEGVITSTNLGMQRFNIVVLSISTAGTSTGLNIGDTPTVQYSTLPPTPFDVDFIHADNVQVSTANFTFAKATDLAAGQQVSILRNGSSTANLLMADRVRLRSSRLTATVQSVGSPNIYLFNLPSLFFGHGGVTQIQVQTTSAMLLENNKLITLSLIPVSGVVSVRGPLFNTGTTTQSMVATKVVLK
jgi:Domain of unknown function (DUF4382)